MPTTFQNTLASQVINQAPIGIYTLDKNGIIDSFNPKMVELAGAKSAGEVIGLNALEMESYKKVGLDRFFREGLSGKSFEVETPYTSITGNRTTWRYYQGVPIFDKSGKKVEKLLLLVTDITKSKKIELKLKEYSERLEKIVQKRTAALQESQTRFRDVSLSMADWIWEIDEDGKYTYCSGRYEQILGYSKDEIIGRTPFDFMDDKEAQKMKKLSRELAGAKKPIVDIENWNVRKDGKKVCVLTNAVPIIDDNGNLLGYRGVDKDITERKLVEEKIKESEMRFRMLFDRVFDALIITDEKQIIFDINQSACRLLGYGKNELLGKSIWDIHPEEERIKIQNAIVRIIKANVDYLGETAFIAKDGHIIPVEAGGAVLTIGGKKYIIGSFRDITERKKSEAKVHAHTRDLEKLNKIMVGRELKMTELKNKIAQLEKQLQEKKSD